MNYLVLSPGSALLPAVVDLWRQHSSTLGFFPLGAFEEYCGRGRLIVAIDAASEVCGYLAFRTSRDQAVVVHLCVSPNYRNKGIATRLFRQFQQETILLRGARATCRADYDAASLWPKLGFRLVEQVPAKEAGRQLQRWWLDYGHPNLFTAPPEAPLAVVDANVFFDLQQAATDRPESHALTADWLRDAFTLAVTPELYSEIDRGIETHNRSSAVEAATLYQQVCGRCDHVNELVEALARLIGAPISSSSHSDHHHLAHAIACDASFFVTRDSDLLDRADDLHAEWGIAVVRPAELVSRFDERARPTLYTPARLDGSHLRLRLVHGAELDTVSRLFQNFPEGESNAGLLQTLRESVANPGTARSQVIEDENGSALALIISSRHGTERRIEALRFRSGSLGETLARHLVWREVVEANADGVDLIRLTDRFASAGTVAALSEVGFAVGSEGAFKPLIRGAFEVDELATRLHQLVPGIAIHRPTGGAQAMVAFAERLCWPAKFIGSDIGCFIVPIRPRWAERLFDFPIASEKLFPFDASLLLRFQNVYYRSPKPAVLEAPGRVLWYVSDDPRERHSKSIRAASLIGDVTVGTAKDLFSRYKRFGVFSFEEVRRTAKGSANEVMAFTFSHTLGFQKPIPFDLATELIRRRTSKSHTFQTVVQIPEGVWMELYQHGNGETSY